MNFNPIDDPLINTMIGAYGVFITLLLVANALMGEMENAIKKVIVDLKQLSN